MESSETVKPETQELRSGSGEECSRMRNAKLVTIVLHLYNHAEKQKQTRQKQQQ